MDRIPIQTRTGIIHTTVTTLLKIPYFNSYLERWDNRIDKTEPIFVDEDKKTLLCILQYVDSKNYTPSKKKMSYLVERFGYYGIPLPTWDNTIIKNEVYSSPDWSISDIKKDLYKGGHNIINYNFAGKNKRLTKIRISFFDSNFMRKKDNSITNDIKIYSNDGKLLFKETVMLLNYYNGDLDGSYHYHRSNDYILNCEAFKNIFVFDHSIRISISRIEHKYIGRTFFKTLELTYEEKIF